MNPGVTAQRSKIQLHCELVGWDRSPETPWCDDLRGNPETVTSTNTQTVWTQVEIPSSRITHSPLRNSHAQCSVCSLQTNFSQITFYNWLKRSLWEKIIVIYFLSIFLYLPLPPFLPSLSPSFLPFFHHSLPFFPPFFLSVLWNVPPPLWNPIKWLETNQWSLFYFLLHSFL